MEFVTVFCPLTTTGTRGTAVQTTGATRFAVDCKVIPVSLVGHVKTIKFDVPVPGAAGLKLTASGGGAGGVANAGENTAVLSPAVSSVKSIPPV
jgi:hypothetical protein